MKITIRPWQKGDEKYLSSYANNIKIANNLRDIFPHPYTWQDASRWISLNDQLSPALNMAILLKNEPVGGIGIALKEDIYRKNAEIGYWVAEDFWGQGIATRAMELMLKYTFDHFDVVRIYASTFDYNQASQRVLLKSGFELEARFRKAVFKNFKYHDELVYSLLKENYLLFNSSQSEILDKP